MWEQIRPLLETTSAEHEQVARLHDGKVDRYSTTPFLSADCDLLGRERQARGNTGGAADQTDRGLRRRATARAADTAREEAVTMTSIQPELWVDSPGDAIRFYEAAFGATVLHRVGEGDDSVAQLGVGDAAFWVAGTSATLKRLSPRAIDGATSRTLLVVEDPASVVRQSVAAGARESSPVGDEHGWRLGRIVDPFGHEWEIGSPLGAWPP
jgi:PhnB protein